MPEKCNTTSLLINATGGFVFALVTAAQYVRGLAWTTSYWMDY